MNSKNSRIRAIPIYLSSLEAVNLYNALDNFFKVCADPNHIDRFSFIIGQNPFCEDTYLKITYEGLDDVETVLL